MALTLGDNFSYQGAKPLDARLKYDTLANMKAVGDATMYDGCMAYCSGTDKTYQWKSTNSVDASTGRWREFSSGGGGGTDYTAGDGIDITNDVISTKQSEEGDIDEIIDVYPQAGELVSIVNAFNRGDLYSTDEKMIGQWINSKPLYQKVLSGTFGTITDGTWSNISVALPSDAENAFIKGGYNFAIYSVGSVTLPYTNNSIDKMLKAYITNGNVVIASNWSQYANTTIYVVVCYTKTTDTAISIGSTTEYSTDEKVVGTWIDGKPLYQKTITGTISVDTDKTSKTTTLGNVSEDLDVVASIDGIRQHENKSVFVSLNASAGASNAIYVCNLFVNSGTGNLVVEDNRLADNGRIILATVKYTKTTS